MLDDFSNMIGVIGVFAFFLFISLSVGVLFFIDAAKLVKLHLLGISYVKGVARIKSIRRADRGYTVNVTYDGMLGSIDYLSDDPDFSARVNEDVIAYYANGSKKLLAIDFSGCIDRVWSESCAIWQSEYLHA